MPEHKSGDEIERVLKVRQIPKNIAKNPCEKGVGEPKNPFAYQQRVWIKATRFASESLSAKRLPKFALGPFQDGSLPLRQTFTGAVDVKVQHRHG